MGPRTASAFLVVTAVLFAALLAELARRSISAGGGAPAVLALAIVVGLFVVVIGVLFARGVTQGRL